MKEIRYLLTLFLCLRRILGVGVKRERKCDTRLRCKRALCNKVGCIGMMESSLIVLAGMTYGNKGSVRFESRISADRQGRHSPRMWSFEGEKYCVCESSLGGWLYLTSRHAMQTNKHTDRQAEKKVISFQRPQLAPGNSTTHMGWFEERKT